MKRTFIAFSVLLISSIYCHPEERRDPKWFLPRRTLTTVVLQRRLITEMIPSSCAVIEPTLQPCRNIRRLDIQPSPPRKVQSTEAPLVPVQMLQRPADNKKPPLEPSSDGGSWLWSGVTTVTQILVSDMTVKMQDPKSVVTFSVKGCKPTRLPFDLPYCKDNVITETKGPTNVATPALRTADIHYIEE